MHILTVYFGKLSSKSMEEEYHKYFKRLKSFGNVQEIILKDSKKKDTPSIMKDNLVEFQKRVPDYDLLVSMSEEGKLFSSEQFAKQIEKWQMNQYKKVVFLIGSAYGLPEELRKKCDLLMSMSPMTFTHDMARVIFVEQLYRAFTITKNHPYHH